MKTPEHCEGCNQCFAPIDQQSCWGCKNGDCNTSKRGLLNATMKKKIEQFEGGVIALCVTYSQVNKALCGKENATPSELLQAVSQLKSRLAQAERERDTAIVDLKQAAESGYVCTGCKHNVDFDRLCEEADFDCKSCKQPCMCKTCEHNSNYEWRGVPENTKETTEQ